jgi:hypothetical protein
MFTTRNYLGVVMACQLLQACSAQRDDTRLTAVQSSPAARAPEASNATEAARQLEAMRGEDMALLPGQAEPLLPTWCGRAGAGIGERLILASAIIDTYLDNQEAACETAALGADLTDDQFEIWLEYLIDYTYLLFWCPMPYEVQGGISVFGPANTSVTGATPHPLGRDDVERLIGMYVDAFTEHLVLSDAERAQLTAHLWSTAEAEIDPTLSSALSVCP